VPSLLTLGRSLAPLATTAPQDDTQRRCPVDASTSTTSRTPLESAPGLTLLASVANPTQRPLREMVGLTLLPLGAPPVREVDTRCGAFWIMRRRNTETVLPL